MRSLHQRSTRIPDSWSVHHLSHRKASCILAGYLSVQKQDRSQREPLTLEQDSLRFCSRPRPSRARPSMQSAGYSKENNAICRMYTEVQLGWAISLGGLQVKEWVAYAGKIPVRRWRHLLQFYDRCSTIESADDSLEFQDGHVKLIPERRCRKGMLLGAWRHFMWCIKTALPVNEI